MKGLNSICLVVAGITGAAAQDTEAIIDFFTQTWTGLPMWAWVAMAGGVLIIVTCLCTWLCCVKCRRKGKRNQDSYTTSPHPAMRDIDDADGNDVEMSPRNGPSSRRGRRHTRAGTVDLDGGREGSEYSYTYSHSRSYSDSGTKTGSGSESSVSRSISNSQDDSDYEASPAVPDIPLPKGWKMYRTPDGYPYYYHADTDHTQWNHPMLAPSKKSVASGEPPSKRDRNASMAAAAAVADEKAARKKGAAAGSEKAAGGRKSRAASRLSAAGSGGGNSKDRTPRGSPRVSAAGSAGNKRSSRKSAGSRLSAAGSGESDGRRRVSSAASSKLSAHSERKEAGGGGGSARPSNASRAGSDKQEVRLSVADAAAGSGAKGRVSSASRAGSGEMRLSVAGHDDIEMSADESVHSDTDSELSSV